MTEQTAAETILWPIAFHFMSLKLSSLVTMTAMGLITLADTFEEAVHGQWLALPLHAHHPQRLTICRGLLLR